MKSKKHENESVKIIISDPFEIFAKWQKELNYTLSVTHLEFQEMKILSKKMINMNHFI